MTKHLYHIFLLQWAVLVVVPLLAGATVYRFLRSKRPAIFGDGTVLELPLPGVVLQSFPSLLWSFALASALLLVWRPSAKMGVLLLGCGATVVSVFFEFWQAADAGHGTFDWNDVLFSGAGCLFSMLIFSKIKGNENHN